MLRFGARVSSRPVNTPPLSYNNRSHTGYQYLPVSPFSRISRWHSQCHKQAQEAMAPPRSNFRKDFLYLGDLGRWTQESPGHIVATVRKQRAYRKWSSTISPLQVHSQWPGPPARLLFLKVVQLSEAVPPTGDQVFKFRSLTGTFHTQTTIYPFNRQAWEPVCWGGGGVKEDSRSKSRYSSWTFLLVQALVHLRL